MTSAAENKDTFLPYFPQRKSCFLIMEELADQYTRKYAREKEISEHEAARRIDHCFKVVSANRNIPYYKVYQAFYDLKFLTTCLMEKCSELKLRECSRQCNCVVFEGRCISRQFPQTQLINRDPDKFARKLNAEELEQLVQEAAYLYYNFDGGGLTDNSFDALEYNLNQRLKQRDVVTTVDSGVSAVIAGSLGEITPKLEQALRLKIPVYTVPEFMREFTIDLA